ncbi:hypothetical protein EDC01DRAFT_424431 [Geopyxis carbonaria]|nr:hypothetical protein EDC01DRAFT_424431 [Geopyxis carbonaria]
MSLNSADAIIQFNIRTFRENLVLDKLLNQAFGNADTADFSIVANDIVFPAHRLIIDLHTNFFKKALESGFRESVEKQIKLPEHDGYTVYCFLHFCYVGDYPVIETPGSFYAVYNPIPINIRPEKDCMIRHLRIYKLADFLDVPGLKIVTAARFKRSLDKAMQLLVSEQRARARKREERHPSSGKILTTEDVDSEEQHPEDNSDMPTPLEDSFLEDLKEVVSFITDTDDSKLLYDELAIALADDWVAVSQIHGLKEFVTSKPTLMWDIMQKHTRPGNHTFAGCACPHCERDSGNSQNSWSFSDDYDHEEALSSPSNDSNGDGSS